MCEEVMTMGKAIGFLTAGLHDTQKQWGGVGGLMRNMAPCRDIVKCKPVGSPEDV